MADALLIAVVADELEEEALALARAEGACHATVLEGRGIGFPEHVTFFGITYEGLEKILVWLLDEASAARIAERLNRELRLLEPFQGLAFCLPVSRSAGIDCAMIRAHIERHGKRTQ